MLSAAWTYGPFGETLAQTGPATGELMYRFSTKPADPDTGHVRYQLRTYAPATGRWLSRDPIEEEGGLNLYGFVGNGPVGRVDLWGLEELVLSYDLAQDMWGSWAARERESWSEIVDDIERRLAECDCIKLIRVGGHGYPGQFTAGGDADGSHIDLLPTLVRSPVSGTPAHGIRTALQRIARRLCEGGKIELISCSSFYGPEGADLRQSLEEIFGAGRVVGYECPVIWGPFGDVYEAVPTKSEQGEKGKNILPR